MGEKVGKFEDLEVWKEGMRLSAGIGSFSFNEMESLCSQLKR